MIHKIKSVYTKDNLIIVATFVDGSVKEYDIKNMFKRFPQMNELKLDNKLFSNVQVDTGGYGISWNDDLDLDANTIWEYGINNVT